MIPIKKVIVSLFCLLWAGGLWAQALPEPMSPRRLVNDFAGLMTSQQQQELEDQLVAFGRETSTQIAVVTVVDLDGYAASDFTQRLYDKWGVGQSGKNNGILILIKPKMPDSRGEAFISVGYGLEGVIPDITAGRIVENEMLPHFRQDNYAAGIDAAANVVMQLTRGEFTADQYGKSKSDVGANIGGFIITLLVLMLLIITRIKGKGGRGGNNGGRGGRGVWFPPVIMGGGSGGFGGGSSGGGFGGFGGGMSGGGGGGRSW